MVISILGGMMKGYNQDEMLRKKVEAEALALGQKGILDRKALEDKRAYDKQERRDFEDYKNKNKPKTTFTVPFGQKEKIDPVSGEVSSVDLGSINFPTREKFTTDVRTGAFSIENLLRNLDTNEKVEAFKRIASSSEGGWGPQPIESLKTIRTGYGERVGPDGEMDPIGVNVNVPEDHPFYSFFGKLRAKIEGVNLEDIRDDSLKILNIAPAGDGRYNIMGPGDDESQVGEQFLYRNEQVLGPGSRFPNMLNLDNVNVLYGEGLSKKKLQQASVFDIWNRNLLDEKQYPKIHRDWDNFYTVIGKGPDLNQEGIEIPGTSEGLKLQVYVRNDEGETVLEDRYVSTGWDINSFRESIYGAMNKATFRNGAYASPDDDQYNNSPSSPYGDLSAIADAGDLAESQIFLALDIFSNMGSIDAMSTAGTVIKFINDAVLAPNSQMNQLISGFNALVSGTIDADWNTMSDDRKDEVRKAEEYLSNYMQMDKTTRDKEFAKIGTQRVLLDQIFTLLAYNVALTTQGGTSLSARVSNEDYDNSKSAVVGGTFDNVENRMLGLMQYYQLTVPKAFSFHLLDNENGVGISAKQRRVKNELLPVILNRSVFDTGIQQQGAYRDPYSMLNYLATRPNAKNYMQIWAKSVQMAYRTNPEIAYDPYFDPNTSEGSTALTPP